MIDPTINKNIHLMVNMVIRDDKSSGSYESKEEEECNIFIRGKRKGIPNPTSIHRNDKPSFKYNFNYNYVNQLKDTTTKIHLYELVMEFDKHR